MALLKNVLKEDIYNGLNKLYKAQAAKATTGDESEDPNDVIDNMTDKISTILSDAIDKYIKNGDIKITQSNITVTAPNGSCTVTPASPAKVE